MDIQELEEKKEKIYSFLTSDEYTPMKLKELASLLQVPKYEKEEFKEVIALHQHIGEFQETEAVFCCHPGFIAFSSQHTVD